MDQTPDVKARAGIVPPPTAARASRKGFFSAQMLLGDGREVMTPLRVDETDSLSEAHYVAQEGERFAIKVMLAAPAPEGKLYGARVYIDQGGATNRFVYDCASSNGQLQDYVTDREGTPTKRVDDSQWDHFFWIAAGEKEYIIDGFYHTPTSSRSFIFSKPEKTVRVSGSEAGEKRPRLEDILAAVGCIRVQFSNVKGMRARAHEQEQEPSVAGIDTTGYLDKKVRLATGAGQVVHSQVAHTARVAELEDDIVYECRLHYNDFIGWRRRRPMWWGMVET